MNTRILLPLLLIGGLAHAQVITTDPIFPTVESTVTIIFDELVR